MLFRDNPHAVETIRTMLATVGLERLWTGAGPTDEAKQMRLTAANLAPEERVLLLAAFDLWAAEAGGHVLLDQALKLREPQMRAVFQAVAAARLAVAFTRVTE